MNTQTLNLKKETCDSRSWNSCHFYNCIWNFVFGNGWKSGRDLFPLNTPTVNDDLVCG